MKQRWDKCVEMGKPAIPPLIDTLQSQDDVMRQGATEALEKIGSPAIRPLIDALQEARSIVPQNERVEILA
jgi:HEAT repeat protein